MGQTLTHGVYLPDEGERNCYSGLAANWSILDGAVGTVAEHTSALAGKAPLVHTHTKADITDLFNSANVWTDNNTFSKAITVAKNSDTNFFFNAKHTAAELGSLPSSDQALTLAFKDKNDDNLCYARVYYETTGGNSFRIFVRNKYTSGSPSTSGTTDYTTFQLKLNADQSKEGILRASFRPYDNNTYDLGSSSYQWNNLYAKNYYYNGTAWGLDKANTWSENNTFSKTVSPSDITGIGSNTMAFSGLRSVIFFNTTGSSNRQSYGTFLYSGYTAGSKPDNYGQLQLFRSTDKKGETNNGLIPDTSFTMWRVAPHYLIMDFMNAVRVTNDGTENSLKPITNNATDLGTSTNKWKSFNGLNPGALSLPGNSSGINTDNWDKTGATVNSYTPAVDGWLVLRCADVAGDYLFATWSGGAMRASVTGQGLITLPTVGLCLYLPVKAGTTVDCVVKATNKFGAFIYPCLGNV